MARTATQERAARKLRRDRPWIQANPDAAALAAQLIYLARTLDTQASTGEVDAGTGMAYLETRKALLSLESED